MQCSTVIINCLVHTRAFRHFEILLHETFIPLRRYAGTQQGCRWTSRHRCPVVKTVNWFRLHWRVHHHRGERSGRVLNFQAVSGVNTIAFRCYFQPQVCCKFNQFAKLAANFCYASFTHQMYSEFDLSQVKWLFQTFSF